MRQKNYKWVYYLVIIAVLGGVFYIAAKDITPIKHHVEQDVAIEYKK